MKKITTSLEKEVPRFDHNTSSLSPLLKVNGLVKVFSGTIAVNGVDFEIEHGQIVTVISENSIGKSTSKNLLIGLLEPDRGTVGFVGKASTACLSREQG